MTSKTTTLSSGSDASVDASKSPDGTLTKWLLVVLVVVIFAGGLFGYDQGVISARWPGSSRLFR